MAADALYKLLRPAVFGLPAERAHDLALTMAERVARSPMLLKAVTARFFEPPDPVLATTVFGLAFDNPVGLAAGLDKNGVAIDFWAALGFGFVEVGTVTPGQGQPGNDKPRMARLVRDRAIVNRMGFNNRGADALAQRLAARKSKVIVGGNIGKAKVTALEHAAGDYERAMLPIWPLVDYIAVNVSSPNTPGLRSLQTVEALRPLLTHILATDRDQAERYGKPSRPILLKLAPDLHDADLEAIAALALELGLAGLIATNTTLDRSGLSTPAPIEGGLSGAPLTARALACTRVLRRVTEGRIPIIGVGGIHTAEHAYQRVRAGASLLQVYTSFVYEGPTLAGTLEKGLASFLRRDGFHSISEAVGVDAARS